MHWRTHVIDVATAQSSLEVSEELYSLTDVALSATQATVESSHNLLDFDEYKTI